MRHVLKRPLSCYQVPPVALSGETTGVRGEVEDRNNRKKPVSKCASHPKGVPAQSPFNSEFARSFTKHELGEFPICHISGANEKQMNPRLQELRRSWAFKCRTKAMIPPPHVSTHVHGTRRHGCKLLFRAQVRRLHDLWSECRHDDGMCSALVYGGMEFHSTLKHDELYCRVSRAWL